MNQATLQEVGAVAVMLLALAGVIVLLALEVVDAAVGLGILGSAVTFAAGTLFGSRMSTPEGG